MANVNVHSKVASFVRKNGERFGNKSLSVVISEAIAFFSVKKDECFACPYHKDQVAGYVLGIQKKALSSIRNSDGSSRDCLLCASCSRKALDLAKSISKSSMHGTMAKVVNDALFEHITRPSQCAGCKVYKAMCAEVHEERMPTWKS